MSSKRKRRLHRDCEDARKKARSEQRRRRRREKDTFEAMTTASLQQADLHKEKCFPAIVEELFQGRPVSLPPAHPMLPLLSIEPRRGSFAHRLCARIAEVCPQLFGTPCHNAGRTYADALVFLVPHSSFALRDPAEWQPRTRSVHRNFDALIQYLFVKYPTHSALRSYLLVPNPHPALLHSFFAVAQGASLYKLKLPIPLTKKMCHLFQQAPRSLSLIEAFRWAQLEALGAEGRIFQAIQHTFLGNALTADEDFWLTVLTWLVNHWDGYAYQIGPVLDYICMLREQQPEFSMKGRTPVALLRQMHAWHRELGGAYNIRWKPIPTAGWTPLVVEEDGGKIWSIKEISDSISLFLEGRVMRHCVYSYFQAALSGRLSLWSMTYDAGQGAKRALTIEVNNYNRSIVQVRGKSNRLAREDERALILRWAQQNQFSISYL